jgi:ectoine hydroxylase
MGRIEHGTLGGQTGADMARVAEAQKRLELVHCELEPGTALFFHCNTLHASGPNTSEHPRWSFIACYNAMSNICYFEKPSHGAPIQSEKWDDERVLGTGRRQLAALQTAGAA